jgi:diguanylate cyclase
MAVRDGLTRCYNNKYFKARIEQELIRTRRYGNELTLGMLDIDHFKKVNDTFGHLAGDRVIQAVANAMKACVRGDDTSARYGGEEFALLLPATTLEGARTVTEHVRNAIRRPQANASRNGPMPSVTVSAGIAAFRPGESVEEFIARADKALYASKHEGRDRVTLAG